MKNAVEIGRKVLLEKDQKFTGVHNPNAAIAQGNGGKSSRELPHTQSMQSLQPHASMANMGSLVSMASMANMSMSSLATIQENSSSSSSLHKSSSLSVLPPLESPALSINSESANLPAMSPFKSPTATYWKARKKDPSLPVIQYSPAQKQSTINATLKQTTTNLKILEHTAQAVHTEDCRLFGGKAGHPSHIKLNASKYRRSIDEEGEALKGTRACVMRVCAYLLYA
jgi:hypothetical protein